MADPTALAQAAYESIAHDEALRGNLTDDGFNPLVEWASRALLSAANNVATLPDVEAQRRMDDAGRAMKQAMAAVVLAAQNRSRGDLLALLQAPAISSRLSPKARVTLTQARLGPDADENAKKLVQALVGPHP